MLREKSLPQPSLSEEEEEKLFNKHDGSNSAGEQRQVEAMKKISEQEEDLDNKDDKKFERMDGDGGGRIKRVNQIRTKKSKKRANKKSIRLMKKNRKVKRSINKFSKNLSGGSQAVWKDLLKLSVLPSIPKTGGRKKSSKVYKPLGYKKANKLMKNIKKSIKKIRG